MKYLVYVCLTILIFLSCGCDFFEPKGPPPPDPNVEGTLSIKTDNYANKTLNFYYYIPKSHPKSKKMPVLILIPGLSGSGENMVTPEIKDLAEQEGFTIIAPTFLFDKTNWDSETSYQYPKAWSGQALINIIDEFKFKKGINSGKLYIFGFSAGAQMTGRFACLYPELVSAAAVCGSGGPIGPFRPMDVKFFVGLGNKEDEVRKMVAEDLLNAAKRNKVSVEYKEYEGGHGATPELYGYVIDFFKKVKAENKE